jgi:uroporphyrin-III C-methyltransferase/precorrin-2 dehydrogenase/sirohydrochlorin ferrochelatase
MDSLLLRAAASDSKGLAADAGGAAARRVAAVLLADELDRKSRDDVASPLGEVYLVGAGPGDPDLLTLRALRLMQKADVVVYDRLVDQAIVDLVRHDAERIYVGKRRDAHTLPQLEISELLARLAGEGKRVLRLKGGDPFMFGRGGEEIETLAERKIPFQVCPGITAAAGCSAYSGIPLTHRDHAQACIFVTAQGKKGPVNLDWRSLLQPRQTVAIYMGLSHLEELMHEFVIRGADPDLAAAVIDSGTRRSQRVVTGTVSTLAEKARQSGLQGPTIIIVGSVVTLRDRFDWYSPEPAEVCVGSDEVANGPAINGERVRESC